MTLLQSVECPHCGAAPGRPCVTSPGMQILNSEHSARRHLAAVTARRTINCVNCNEPIYQDGQSPTDYLHRATHRVRCDGEKAKRYYGRALADPGVNR